jgi:hypothetical protein
MKLIGQVKIQRGPPTLCGTFGTLEASYSSTSFTCVTLEPPWYDNRRNVSCIPAGKYRCSRLESPSKGSRYQVLNVPGRDAILFHTGNWAGDERAGLKSDSEGCIMLGTYVEPMAPPGVEEPQYAIKRSYPVVSAFQKFFDWQDIELEVVDFQSIGTDYEGNTA